MNDAAGGALKLKSMLVNTNVTFRRRRGGGDGEDDDDDEMSLNWPQSLSFPLSPDLVVRKRGTRGRSGPAQSYAVPAAPGGGRDRRQKRPNGRAGGRKGPDKNA